VRRDRNFPGQAEIPNDRCPFKIENEVLGDVVEAILWIEVDDFDP
jgi:hypothetical protein